MKRITGKKIRTVSLLALLSLLSLSVKAQVVDNAMHIDTLSMANRISLRTNGVDWLMLVPNVGLEFDVMNKNWSRWSVGVNGRMNWRAEHTFLQPQVWDLQGVEIDFRNYWRTRKIDGQSVKAHTLWYDRLFSQRSRTQKHPLTTYYRGFFLAYDKYALKLSLGGEGHSGKIMTFGVQYGIVRPIYKFPDGSSVDVDFGFSIGAGFAHDKKIVYDQAQEYYQVVSDEGKWKVCKMPIVHDLRAGIVYRIGKKSVYEKHRFRYDVDKEYREKVDSIVYSNMQKMYIDSLNADQYRRVYTFFQQQIDSLQQAIPMTKERKQKLKAEKKGGKQ